VGVSTEKVHKNLLFDTRKYNFMKISTIEIREKKEVIQNREQLSIQTKGRIFYP